MYHSRISTEQIDEVNHERLEREAEARNEQHAAEEQARAAEIAAAVEQQVQAQVEQALRQERMREQARNTREVSTERRRRRQEVFDEDVDEDVTGAEAMEHLQRRAWMEISDIKSGVGGGWGWGVRCLMANAIYNFQICFLNPSLRSMV